MQNQFCLSDWRLCRIKGTTLKLKEPAGATPDCNDSCCVLRLANPFGTGFSNPKTCDRTVTPSAVRNRCHIEHVSIPNFIAAQATCDLQVWAYVGSVGPRVGDAFGKSSDRWVRWRLTIKDRRNHPRRHECERCQQPDIPFDASLTLRDFGERGHTSLGEVLDPGSGFRDGQQQSLAPCRDVLIFRRRGV